MPRKSRSTAQTGVQVVNTPEDSPNIEENDSLEVDPLSGWSPEIQEWFDHAQLTVKEVCAYLYRVDDNGKNWIEHKYQGSVPDPDQVGRNHGSGRYKIIFTAPGKKSTSVRFNVGSKYDAIAAAAPGSAQGQPVQVFNQGMDFAGMLGMMKEMMSVFAPIMKMQMGNHSPVAGMDSTAMIETMAVQSEMIGQIMSKNIKQQMEMYSEIAKEKRALMMNDPNLLNGPEDETGIIAKITPLVEKWLPVLLGKGPAAGLVIEEIKKSSEYQNLLQERNTLANVVNALNQKFGEDKIRPVLEELGLIEKPAPVSVQGVQ